MATLLGYKVGYEENTNTATVDSQDYVKPVTTTTAQPEVRTNSRTIDVNTLSCIKGLSWQKPPLKDSSSLLKNAGVVSSCVNGLYQAPELGPDTNHIHPESPFKQELVDSMANLVSMKKGSNASLNIYCDSKSVNISLYGYDAYGKCKGCVASYTLEATAIVNGVSSKDVKQVTSIFLFKDADNMTLCWLGDYDIDLTTTTTTGTDYVSPATQTTTTTTTTSPDLKDTSKSVDVGEIPCVKALNWQDAPIKDYSSLLSSNYVISNCINSLYQSPETGPSSECIHPDSPLKQELKNAIDNILAVKNSLGKTVSLNIYCNSSSVSVSKYGYDANGKCRGCLATYTMEYTFNVDGQVRKETQTLSSVFVFKDSDNLKLAWVADLVK